MKKLLLCLLITFPVFSQQPSTILPNGWLGGLVVPTKCSSGSSPAFYRYGDGSIWDCANNVYVLRGGSGAIDIRSKGAINGSDVGSVTTNAINAACTIAQSTGAPIYFPPGTWIYNGNGCTGTIMQFLCAGIDASIIELGTGKYLVDDNQAWSSFSFVGCQIQGGAGAIRNRYTGSNVIYQKTVRDSYFTGYTAAAISTNASDDPYWIITGNQFYGLNTTTSIGIALDGLTDGDVIENNNFTQNAVHLKLALGGNNAKVLNNCFDQAATGTSRVSVWIVPATSSVNAGTGFLLTGDRFGNEFLDSTDYRILYADESTGTYFGDRLPSFTASTGYITTHSIHDIAVFGTSSFHNPVIYSFTPNVLAGNYGPIVAGGTSPGATLVLASGTIDSSNQFGNVLIPGTPSVQPTMLWSVPALVTPANTIGWSANATYSTGFATLAAPITITRIDVQIGTPGVGCSTLPIIGITDGTTSVGVTIPNGVYNVGSTFSQAYSSGDAIRVAVVGNAAGCSVLTVVSMITVQYQMTIPM